MPQRSRYALPAVIEPPTERCFIVHIPNDQNYIAAFKGALYDLTKPYVWGNDDNHTALLAAARMLTMWSNLQEIDCAMPGQQTQIEFDPQCGLRWSYDGGATWNTASFDICAQTWAENAIQNALNDGTIPRPGGQPGPSNPPAPGACKTYHVALSANNRWHCPSPIQAGDSVHITNATGGWSIGELAWYCPTGARYLLNACHDDMKTHVAGDPLASAFHMQVVGQFDSTWLDPMAAPYIVPAGTAQTELFLQANNATLTGGQGQVEFDVEICSGIWTQHFDFRASNGGFSNVRVGGAGVYVLGTGWASSPWLGTQQIQVQLAVSSCHILGIRMAGGLTNNYLSDAGVQNQSGFMMRHYGLTGATFDISDTVDVAGVTLIFIYNWQHQDGTHDNMAHTVTDLWITGTGTNPFA